MTDDALAGGSADPYSRKSICLALHSLHAESGEYWSTFDTPTFLSPLGTAWSPAENVRHLTKSMRAVTTGLRVPGLLLLLAYRGGPGRSRTSLEVRDVYLARLALGASAGRFTPEPRQAPPDPAAERARIMDYHARAVDGLSAAIGRWNERALDRRRLPHPLLGALTVREMLLFTLYHNRHHVENVRRRR